MIFIVHGKIIKQVSGKGQGLGLDGGDSLFGCFVYVFHELQEIDLAVVVEIDLLNKIFQLFRVDVSYAIMKQGNDLLPIYQSISIAIEQLKRFFEFFLAETMVNTCCKCYVLTIGQISRFIKIYGLENLLDYEISIRTIDLTVCLKQFLLTDASVLVFVEEVELSSKSSLLFGQLQVICDVVYYHHLELVLCVEDLQSLQSFLKVYFILFLLLVGVKKDPRMKQCLLCRHPLRDVFLQQKSDELSCDLRNAGLLWELYLCFSDE